MYAYACKRAFLSLCFLSFFGCAAGEADESGGGGFGADGAVAGASGNDGSPASGGHGTGGGGDTGGGAGTGAAAGGGGDTGSGGTGGTGTPVNGLGPWTGNDNVAPSANPPSGLSPSQVPMFVSLGFDDNAYSGLSGSSGDGGMDWATAMLAARTNPDASPVRASFFNATVYIGSWMSESPTFVKRAWNSAYKNGNEIGNHTHSHPHGSAFTGSQWQVELETCNDWLSKPFDPNEPNTSPDNTKGAGVSAADIRGFRTPYLEYGDALFSTLKNLGFWYDCSIEEGWQYDQNGKNYFWPFTLNNGSPGHDVQVSWGSKQPITGEAGLWEMPVHPVIVPPDSVAAQYGIEPGLRAKLKSVASWFDKGSGKVTGFDYNLWVSFGLTKAEVLATLKYTFDLRMQGNRAPFLFGAHTDYYSSKYTGAPNASAAERRQAIEEFLDYVLSHPEARVKSYKEILDWVRNPTTL
jgi:hypothetical protein